ncbi:MAG: hypothetical protein QGI33_05775, partial [Candidatus Brocadiia bacterium]|nr:hypothetical protein [Candidatus Brocadiia bacterium]
CLISTALQFKIPDLQARAAAAAMEFYVAAGREDLAAQAQALAASLAAGDTGIQLTCALVGARSAVAQEDWQRVVDTLQPVVGADGDAEDKLHA